MMDEQTKLIRQKDKVIRRLIRALQDIEALPKTLPMKDLAYRMQAIASEALRNVKGDL